MSDRYFLDTNIFVYSFDEGQPGKQAISFAIIAEALQKGLGLISTQVIQEFLNVATRKFNVPLKPEDGKIYLERVLYPLCQVFPNQDLYKTALDIVRDTNYSFCDALILAGAIQGGCTILYSEDLSAGQQVGNLRIANPFSG